MGRNKKKVHCAQSRLYHYHKSNQEILGKISIKELKVLDLEYMKHFQTYRILFAGKQHENIKNDRNMYQKYQYNVVKIKQVMNDVKMSNFVDFSK